MSKQGNFVILRYERVTLHDLGGIEAHGKRLGEDLEHVDGARSDLNEFLFGHADLRDIAKARIADLQQCNAARKIAGLRKSRHRRQAKELETAIEVAGDDPFALADVIGWPWDNKNVKPFTEGFISISHEWFLDEDGNEDPAKLDAFRSFVMGYLEEEFGREVIYARLDRDEKTPHVSFVLAPEHENKKTRRRQLSHHSHRLFGMREVRALFDDEQPDPLLTRRSYELLQDRIAAYATRQGLDIRRGERRAEAERMQRATGQTVVKRRHITPARGREIAAIEASEAAKANEQAQAALREAELERDRARAQRDQADRARQSTEQLLRETKKKRAALIAREEAMQIGAQAIIAEELTYAPPTDARPEALAWGRNKPQKKRREWLKEKIQPARDWLIGFARTVFGFQQRSAAVMAEQTKRAEAIAAAEQRLGRRAPPSIADILEGLADAHQSDIEIPHAWAVQAGTSKDEIDEHLARMTNAQLCNAYAPTRDARNLALHTDKHRQYETGLALLSREAARRGLDIERREHRPETATDAKRAQLHTDCAPAETIKVVRWTRDRVRSR